MPLTRERIALFVDGSNLYASSRSLQFNIDYRKLSNHFRRKGHLIRPHYYTAIREDEMGRKKIQPLIDFLRFNGWEVVTKPAKTYWDEEMGQNITKGNMDIELALGCYMLCKAAQLDHVYLFTGDGDFAPLIRAIQSIGVCVTVVSARATVAEEMRKQANFFLDLEDIRDEIRDDKLPFENSVTRKGASHALRSGKQ